MIRNLKPKRKLTFRGINLSPLPNMLNSFGHSNNEPALRTANVEIPAIALCFAADASANRDNTPAMVPTMSPVSTAVSMSDTGLLPVPQQEGEGHTSVSKTSHTTAVIAPTDTARCNSLPSLLLPALQSLRICFRQGLKPPMSFCRSCGTTEVVPFQNINFI